MGKKYKKDSSFKDIFWTTRKVVYLFCYILQDYNEDKNTISMADKDSYLVS